MVVRYYGTEYQPELFKETWRARVILFLARVVSWLERKIEWHVMQYIAEKQKLPAEARRDLENAFREETKARQGTPIMPNVSDELGIHIPTTERYRTRVSNKKDTKPKTYREARVDRTAEMFQIYLSGGRAARYARKRRARLSSDTQTGDLDFELVGPAQKEDGDAQTTA